MSKENNSPESEEHLINNDIQQDQESDTKKEQEVSPEVVEELSKVATNPKKSMLILGIIVLVLVYIIYAMFFSSSDDTDTSKKETKIPVPANVTRPRETSVVQNAIPKLPEPPKINTPKAPKPPEITTPKIDQAALPPLPNTKNTATASATSEPALPSLPQTNVDSSGQNREEAKRKSGIMLKSGAIPKEQTSEAIEQQAGFTKRGNMNYVLGRGKIIDAVLETAINTDTGGEVRAVITRDVYSEWGRNILIPKGSRLFGSYSKGYNAQLGYGRIQISWTQIDLANGYRMDISSPTVDSMGRFGVHGRVDHHHKERFANSLLQSALNITIAKGLDKVVPPVVDSRNATLRHDNASQSITSALSIATDSGKTAKQRRTEICTTVLAGIKDATSTLYTTVKAQCDNLETETGSSEEEKLNSIRNTVINSAHDTHKDVVKDTTETQEQQASIQAYKDLTNTLQTFAKEQEEQLSPTLTVNQGTLVKVYVIKDFTFPKAAIHRRGS